MASNATNTNLSSPVIFNNILEESDTENLQFSLNNTLNLLTNSFQEYLTTGIPSNPENNGIESVVTIGRNVTHPHTKFSILNFTSMFGDRPEWHNDLDTIVTYIMMLNVLNVMLGMGSAIYLKQVIKSIWPPIGVIIGMIGQFLIIPFLGFSFSVLFGFQPYEAIGCLIVSCSPSGTFSNFFTYWLEGDLALSIVMTGCSSVIAFVGMPLNLWLYTSYYVGDESSQIVIPYVNILQSLAFIGTPVIIGMVIRHFFEKIAKIIVKVSSVIAFICFLIVMICWTILYYKIFLSASSLLYVSAIILPLLASSLAYLVACLLRRPHKICRTIGVETGSQNMPIAVSVILLSFDEPEIRAKMMLFPTLYGVFLIFEMIICILLFKSITHCLWRKKLEGREFDICQDDKGNSSERENMLLKNYNHQARNQNGDI